MSESKSGITGYTKTMKNFCIITNSDKDKDLKTTNLIRNHITSQGGNCSVITDETKTVTRLPSEIQCLLVLGGDGTLIQTARNYVNNNIPMIGINLGTLGFLTSVEPEDILECLDHLMTDNYIIEKRMMLSGKVFHQGKKIRETLAMNDIVVTRSGFSRLVEIRLYVNNSLVDVYNGDGVIISTPTGSTGYNLSAGGPVVFPETEVMIITPICPHSLSARSIVVSDSDKITVEIGKRRKTQEEEAMVTYDGQEAVELQSFDKIEIARASEMTEMIKVGQRNFYEILRNKININQ